MRVFILLSVLVVNVSVAQDAETSVARIRPYYETVGYEFVPFTVVGEIPQVETRIREMVRCLTNMPPEHHEFLPPVFIVPQLPGTRTTGGGFYPGESTPDEDIRFWLGKSNRTGIPDSTIEQLLESDAPGLIAITHSRFSPSAREPDLIHHLTVLHEAAHAVQSAVGEVAPTGTSIDELGQVYPRRSLKEHSAEAYARYIGSPSFICREEVISDRAARNECTARVRGLLRRSPAFDSVADDWRPKGNCRNNDELDTLDFMGPPSKGTTNSSGPGVGKGGRTEDDCGIPTSWPPDAYNAEVEVPPTLRDLEGLMAEVIGRYVERGERGLKRHAELTSRNDSLARSWRELEPLVGQRINIHIEYRWVDYADPEGMCARVDEVVFTPQLEVDPTDPDPEDPVAPWSCPSNFSWEDCESAQHLVARLARDFLPENLRNQIITPPSLQSARDNLRTYRDTMLALLDDRQREQAQLVNQAHMSSRYPGAREGYLRARTFWNTFSDRTHAVIRSFVSLNEPLDTTPPRLPRTLFMVALDAQFCSLLFRRGIRPQNARDNSFCNTLVEHPETYIPPVRIMEYRQPAY